MPELHTFSFICPQCDEEYELDYDTGRELKKAQKERIGPKGKYYCMDCLSVMDMINGAINR